METDRIVSLLAHFSIPDREYTYETSASGFIHSSGIVSSAGIAQYVLQKFNTRIFQHPLAVYSNFKEVSRHLIAPSYRHFEWMLTKDQAAFHTDSEGQLWRLLSYVSDSRELHAIGSAEEAFACGKLLGEFHKLLEKAEASLFQVVIQNFHDPSKRWNTLEDALQSGIPERVKRIRSQIPQLEQLRDYAMNAPMEIPLRVCHNDTKLSNLLFHHETHEALCFVDLDTVMPGYFYHDFGDLARTVVADRSEETKEVHPQDVKQDLLIALLNGIRESGLRLRETEIASMAYGMIVLPFLHGIRALTDYAQGDVYYQVAQPDQNWVRALNLLKYAQQVFIQKEALQDLAQAQLAH